MAMTLRTDLSRQIACEMLKSGKVDAVVCVQSDDKDRWVMIPE